MREIGSRVGAILGAENGVCKFLGYGTYEGEAIPKEAVGFWAKMSKEAGNTNPKIKLDNGKVVYGCECWWGSEKEVKERLKPYSKVITVDIDDVRKEHKLLEKKQSDE